MNKPEIDLARRIVMRYALKPPINVEQLVLNYAELVFAPIPIVGVDGVSLNIKVLGKHPKVVVNNLNSPKRIRFTLAHELGHVLIPWHVGTIVDSIDVPAHTATDSHWAIEKEANSFAAELLMPEQWIEELLKTSNDLAKIHETIVTVCDSSPMAAALRLIGYVGDNVIYACEYNGVVEYSWRSANTIASALMRNSEFKDDSYIYAKYHYSVSIGDRSHHWWILPQRIEIPCVDQRPWRDILKGILNDITYNESESQCLMQSINGVISSANSTVKRRTDYNLETLVAACIQRFSDRPKYKIFVQHPDFAAYVYQRAFAFIHG